jgi:hypothetical protein
VQSFLEAAHRSVGLEPPPAAPADLHRKESR